MRSFDLNPYINLFNKLFEIAHTPFVVRHETQASTSFREEIDNPNPGLFRKKKIEVWKRRIPIEPVHSVLCDKKEELKSIEHNLKELFKNMNDLTDYTGLCNFCQLILYAEKVILYPNSPDDSNHIYVDGKLEEWENVTLVIQEEDYYSITFKMDNVNDTIRDGYMNMIKVTIDRLWDSDRLQPLVYTIINGGVKVTDASDKFLIENLNYILAEIIKTNLIDIYNSLLSDVELAIITVDKGYEIVWTNPEEPTEEIVDL